MTVVRVDNVRFPVRFVRCVKCARPHAGSAFVTASQCGACIEKGL